MTGNSSRTGKTGLIGRRVLRKEDDRLLRGFGAFTDDIAEPAGTLHTVFVMSTRAHARIIGIDTAEARQAEGVVAVYTGSDFAGRIKPIVSDIKQPGYQPISRIVMPIDRVRFVGEAIAVVIAESRYLAEDAADLVRVEYDELTPIVDVDHAMQPDAPVLHDDTTGNILFRASYKTPRFDGAFAAADHVVQDTFQSHRLAAVALEPRGCLASYDRGRDGLTLWTSTQIPHIVRTAIADLLDWDETRLRVIAPDVGGGFGTKAYVYPEELIVSFLTRKLQAPVKWISDRREDLMTSAQGRQYRFDVALAFRKDGTLLAAKAKIDCNIGAYPGFPFGASAEAGGAAIYLPGPYRMPDYAYMTQAITTNTCPSGVYRGVAAPVAFFATEALMDRAAHDLGLDPADIRRKNVLVAADLPYTNSVGIRYSAGSFDSCLQRAIEASNYAAFRQAQTADRMRDGKLHGIGIANVVEHTGQGASRYRQRGILYVPGFDAAQVKIEPNGHAIAWVSACTQGQGHLTSFAQIVAEQLGIGTDDVTIIEGDTGQGPYGSGTFASRGAVVAGGAALRASTKVAEKIRRIAAHILEAAPDDLELADGHVYVSGVRQLAVSLRDIAAIAHSMDSRALPDGESFGLEATEYYDPPVASITNAAHVAQVSIDPVTGLVTVEKYVVAHDCGRVINPLIVDGQIHGAVMQGISSVLSEALRYDEDGQLMTGTLMDYLVSTAADAPDITVLHEANRSPDTEGGFKGVGEGGVIGALPAVANAVADALARFGARINRLPLLPHTIVSLMASAAPTVSRD
jgi:carbon-monoxide dehydrogenase large subunit